MMYFGWYNLYICIILYIFIAYIIRNINYIYRIFNFKKAADLVIVHWRQSKRGKAMHHEKISQTHILTHYIYRLNKN